MDPKALNAPLPRAVAPIVATRVKDAGAPRAGLLLTGLSLRGPGGLAVLDDVSLSVPAGSLVAVLGGAGAGKSALLAAIAGSAVPRGQIDAGGRSMARVRPHQRGFGVVRQHDALFPHLTLAQNIGYPLRLRGVGGRQRDVLVQAALDSVQLGGGDRLPLHASPGERQRACWARATIFGPTVLLLDEPLSDQDAAERPAMAAVLRRLQVMLGAATVLATRVAADALGLSDQVAVMHRGRIEQIASPAMLYDQPVSAIAALAAGEANLLPGTVALIDEDGMAQVALECGVTVEGTACADLRPGGKARFFLRPERIAVAPVRASDMGEGAIEATLLEALHLGETIRLRLLVGSGAELLVKRPAAAGVRGLTPGETVALAWQPAHAWVFAGRRQ